MPNLEADSDSSISSTSSESDNSESDEKINVVDDNL